MANVIKTVLTYPLDGSTRDFNIPFEYLARKFVVVTLIGVDRKVLTINTDYRFATRTTISLTKAWGIADGYTTIELRRVTSTTDRLVDFTDGSILRAYDLNIAQIQTMHVAEEARDLTADTIGVNNDGHLDARGRRIVNLADGIDGGDAVTIRQIKAWDDSALNQANRAEQEADRAERAANAASDSASKAKISETNANASELSAGVHAQTAVDADARAQQASIKAEESSTKTAEDVVEVGRLAAQAKSDADRAEEAANRVNDVMTHVDSIASLRALEYVPHNTHVYVDSYFEGLNVGGGIFVLNKESTEPEDGGSRIAASGGGLWERYVETELTFDMFGADRTATSNSLAQIMNCFNAASRLKVGVRQTTGRFKLSGNGDIVIKVNTDLSGATLWPSNWNGFVYIKRDHEWVEFNDTEAPIQKLNQSTEVGVGSAMFSGWKDFSEMDDSFIQYETTQPLFKYRGAPRYRTEFNRVFKDGQLAAPLYYPLHGVKITKLRRLYMTAQWLEVKGITFDESDYSKAGLLIVQDATNVVVKNISYYNRGAYKPINMTRFIVSNSAYIRVENVSCSDVNATSDNKYTYSMSIENSFDVIIDGLTSDGYGWGSTGSNDSQRVTFKNSQLSRIDFHQPAREWLKIDNCVIGNWGILVTIIGDLHVTNCTWLQRDAFNASGFVRSRSDAGGWCDGNLYIKNCTINGRAGITIPAFLECVPDATQGVIDGSPVNFTFFRKVDIDGVTFERGLNPTPTTLLSSTDKSIKHPMIVNVNNWDTGETGASLAIDLSQFKAVNTSPTGNKYTDQTYPQFRLTNCRANTVSIIGRGNTHNPLVYIDNLQAQYGAMQGAHLELVHRGRFEVSNSELSQLDTYSGGWAEQPMAITVNGGKVGTNNANPVNANANSVIKFNGVTVVGKWETDLEANRLFISAVNFAGCSFVNSETGLIGVGVKVLADPSTMSVTFVVPNKCIGQTLIVTQGFDSQGTTTYNDVPISAARMTHRFVTWSGDTKTKCRPTDAGLEISMTASGGNEQFRTIYMK